MKLNWNSSGWGGGGGEGGGVSWKISLLGGRYGYFKEQHNNKKTQYY